MQYLLFLVLITTAANAYAQCDQFDNLLKKGDAYLKSKKPNYQEAINAYTAAILACSDRASEAQKRMAKMVNDINQLKENAFAAERKATAAQKETEMTLTMLKEEQVKNQVALTETQKAQAETQAALQKAEKLINAFYFYGDRFALASKKGVGGWDKLYFLDKNGDPVTRLGEYDKAQQFNDHTGYAEVTREGKDYLLDTFGLTFQASFSISDLNKSITALQLPAIQMDGFPAAILRNLQLEVLILNGTRFNENKLTLPPTISQLTQLKSLHLGFCQLKLLPKEIGQLKNLQKLSIGANYLEVLPGEIGQLKNLNVLRVGGNWLTELPQEVGQLINLQELEIGGNRVSSLPKEIGQLLNLKILGLTSNRLILLPSEIGQLKNLLELGLGFNRLSILPGELCQLKKLKKLDLRENRFSSLPREIGQLSDLQSLDLYNNQLTALPNEISQLKNLQNLSLSNNRLTMLPSEIGQLTNLQFLNLASNQITTLSAGIGQLQNLKWINFSRNQLTTLPADIRCLKSLKEMHLWGNPFPPGYIEQLRKDMLWCEIKF